MMLQNAELMNHNLAYVFLGPLDKELCLTCWEYSKGWDLWLTL
jgi:hypothetical protein